MIGRNLGKRCSGLKATIAKTLSQIRNNILIQFLNRSVELGGLIGVIMDFSYINFGVMTIFFHFGSGPVDSLRLDRLARS